MKLSLSVTCPIFECVSEYIFLISNKQVIKTKKKKKEYKKGKETIEE